MVPNRKLYPRQKKPDTKYESDTIELFKYTQKSRTS